MISEERANRIETKIDQVIMSQTEIAKDVAVLKDRVPCDAPNLCLRIEPRVRSLEDDRTEKKGQWKLVVGISAIVSCLVGIIVQYSKRL